MEYTANLYQLTQDFMNDYPESRYPELMHKLGRPYSCLLIDTHKDYYICVPFRSHINHRNAYMFHGTNRSLHSKSGLDYSKIVLVNNKNYLDDKKVIVDQDEYNEVQKNLDQIVTEVLTYVDSYIAHIMGSSVMHPRQFARKYQFSTLKYFHDIMNI